MTNFSPSFLDELRERLTLSEIIGKRLRLTRAGREFKGCCPFHNEKTPSFYVNDDKKFYHCFGCGAHGDVIGFTMRHEGLSFPAAIEALAGQAGMPIPQNEPEDRERYDRHKRLLDLLERTTVFFEEQLKTPGARGAMNYLKRRGLSDDALARFRLGYAPQDAQALITKMTGEGFTLPEMLAVGLIKKSENRPDHYSFFRNRVMFPVMDKQGRSIAFGGRVMDDGEPKYLNSPDHDLFHKGKLLYGLSRARAAITQGQPLIVVEGYMDVIALVEAGYIGAVAPLGTAMTEDQLALLWKLAPPMDLRDPARDYSPILCFDGDSAGVRAATRAVDRALPMLTASQTVRVAYLPAKEDPDSLLRSAGRSAMQAVLDQAKPMVDVLWDITLSGRRLQTPEDRFAATNAIKQKIAMIRDEPLRSFYHEEMSKRLDLLFGRAAPVAPQQGRITRPFGAKTAPGGRQTTGFRGDPSLIRRKKPTDSLKLRERVLLALMVNYPALFNDFGDDFAQIGFSDPELEAIRQELIGFLSTDSHESLDAATLYRQLSHGGEAQAASGRIDKILSEATYLHAGFARPGRDLKQARQGWKSIWNSYLHEQLQIDLHAANRLWHEDPSDANLARLMALRQQMELATQEMIEQDSNDGLSLSESGHAGGN